MANKQIKRCVECGGPMTFETRKDELDYKGQKKSFDLEAWWCQGAECGEAILDGEALKVTARARAELKAEVDGVLTPREIAEIREKLDLSQRAASELLGGGPMAFQKYESGKSSVSAAMSNLLHLLSNDPERLEEIRRRRNRQAS